MKAIRIDEDQIEPLIKRIRSSLTKLVDNGLRPSIYVDLLSVKLLGDRMTIVESWLDNVVKKRVNVEEPDMFEKMEG